MCSEGADRGSGQKKGLSGTYPPLFFLPSPGLRPRPPLPAHLHPPTPHQPPINHVWTRQGRQGPRQGRRQAPPQGRWSPRLSLPGLNPSPPPGPSSLFPALASHTLSPPFPPAGPPRQHPGHHQARHPPPRPPRRRQAHQRPHLRGDPRRPQGLPRERHPRRGHLHRARAPEDRHGHGRRVRAQAPGPHPVRLRRIKRRAPALRLFPPPPQPKKTKTNWCLFNTTPPMRRKSMSFAKSDSAVERVKSNAETDGPGWQHQPKTVCVRAQNLTTGPHLSFAFRTPPGSQPLSLRRTVLARPAPQSVRPGISKPRLSAN